MNKHLSDTVSLPQSLAYSFPVLATTFLVIPAGIILPGMYAKHYGFKLTTVATILLLARLFDAITDPIVGYYADRYRSRTGTRKPWIIFGCLGFVISSYFLYIPPSDVSTTYLLAWFMIFYLSWTVFEIPHLAWGGELSCSSQGKTKIYSLRYIFLKIGTMLFYALPLLPFFPAKEFSPASMKMSVCVVAVLMLPLLYLCIKLVPNGHNYELRKSETFRIVLTTIIDNRPLLVFLSAFLLGGIGMGMWTGGIFIFADAYLGLGEKLPLVLALTSLIGILTVKIWYKTASKYGKKRTWSMGMALIILGIIATGLLKPDKNIFLLFLFVMSAINIGAVSLNIMAPSLLADIVDYGTWKFGKDRAATYFALYQLTLKANIGIGGALGLGIAGWYGFDPTLLTHSDESLFGLRLGIAYLPAIFILASVAFISLIAINPRRHKAIQKRLVSRLRTQSNSAKIETPSLDIWNINPEVRQS